MASRRHASQRSAWAGAAAIAAACLFTLFTLPAAAQSQTDLPQTDLSQTDLSQTDLSQTDLSQTDLSQTDLSQTDLSCTQSQPCRTLQRGYNAANPGDAVELAAGAYAAQGLSGSKPAPAITFRSASGANVSVGLGIDNCASLDISASHVAIEDMTLDEACATHNGQTDITFRNVHAPDGFQVNSSTNISFIGGDYGPTSGYQNWNNGVRKGYSTMPANILIDGAKVHNVACSPSDPGCHIECLIVGAVNGLTIRNSRFYRCPIMDVFFETFNGPISNVTFENNFMADATEPLGGPGTGRPSIQFKGNSTVTNVLVRFNSLRGPVDFESGGNPVNARVYGNLGQRLWFQCHPAVNYSYNVWKDSTCGSTDRSLNNGPLPWVNDTWDASMDYHLTGGIAQDFVPGDGDGNIATDIDGQARPMGVRRDAGADEHG